MSKLSIKANALREESEEISVILNTVTSVLKAAAAGVNGVDGDLPTLGHGQLTSFSSMDLTAQAKQKKSTGNPLNNDKDEHNKIIKDSSRQAAHKNDEGASAESASLSSSTERAIEVLAGLVGRSHVKEEIVHGSYR